VDLVDSMSGGHAPVEDHLADDESDLLAEARTALQLGDLLHTVYSIQ